MKGKHTWTASVELKRLDYFITPTLEDRPDIVIIHIGSNDITHNIVGQVDVKDNVNRIINIGKKCLSYGVKEVIVSSIFIKKQFKLARIIRQVNDLLHDECKINNFQFISNDNITREVLWRDGLHLNNDGTYIFASNLADFLNDFIFSKTIWLTEDDKITVGKGNCKQGFNSSIEVKHNNSIDYNNNVSNEKMIEKSDFLRILRVKHMNRLIIGNLNINPISSKFDQLKLFVQCKVDILVVTETKSKSTFLTSQFVIDGYSEP